MVMLHSYYILILYPFNFYRQIKILFIIIFVYKIIKYIYIWIIYADTYLHMIYINKYGYMYSDQDLNYSNIRSSKILIFHKLSIDCEYSYIHTKFEYTIS